MEKSLRYELITHIPELTNQIYPTNAPESAAKPYLVYSRITTKEIKTLEGFTGKGHLSYMFSIMATKYSDMKDITKTVEELLKGMLQRTIGEENIYIEDISINNIHEVYEHELKVNRGIIDFTIYY